MVNDPWAEYDSSSMHERDTLDRMGWSWGIVDTATKRDAPLPYPTVDTSSPELAYETVLQQAGSFPRDRVTRRVVRETLLGVGWNGRVDPPHTDALGTSNTTVSGHTAARDTGAQDDWYPAPPSNPLPDLQPPVPNFESMDQVKIRFSLFFPAHFILTIFHMDTDSHAQTQARFHHRRRHPPKDSHILMNMQSIETHALMYRARDRRCLV